MLESIVFIAFLWGTFSAVSLPLGAGIGLAFKPNQTINSAFMAFGAGALLFALTIELFGHVPHSVEEHGTAAVLVAVGAAISGGLLFDLLNNLLNNQGAFLRKLSSARRYVAGLKMDRAERLIQELSQIEALSMLPPKKMAQLINCVEEVDVLDGEYIFHQWEEAADMYFILSGQIEINLHEEGQEVRSLARLESGDTFGELGVLLGVPRTADAIARGFTRLYRLNKSDFDRISRNLPELKDELKSLAESRLSDTYVKSPGQSNQEWRTKTLTYLQQSPPNVTLEDVKKEGKHAGGSSAAMAIWLGILIDGIPESLIIGMLALQPEGVSVAFVAGVFLANMPEAMSSAVSMEKGGMKLGRILTMWGSLCLMTGLGAAIGALIFPPHPVGGFFYLALGIEGLAAGAMLTMIAETMLPEASEQGGAIVGISTLLGFIAALLVKIYA